MDRLEMDLGKLLRDDTVQLPLQDTLHIVQVGNMSKVTVAAKEALIIVTVSGHAPPAVAQPARRSSSSSSSQSLYHNVSPKFIM
jgi:hypothetical protein